MKARAVWYLHDEEAKVPETVQSEFSKIILESYSPSISYELLETSAMLGGMYRWINEGMKKIIEIPSNSDKLISKYRVFSSWATNIEYNSDEIDFIKSKIQLSMHKNEVISKIDESTVLSAKAKALLINEVKDIDSQYHLDNQVSKINQLELLNAKFKALIFYSNSLTKQQKNDFSLKMSEITNLQDFIKLEREILFYQD
ncbi:hypothetical protein [Mycoplasma simbae]|uniref:hypothetical protein n=1 Tax=Mycoplasma simbae TaxID=36744 RepID=UPI0004958BB6|nr:hypothetical protein [Mycoplasma simbae]